MKVSFLRLQRVAIVLIALFCCAAGQGLHSTVLAQTSAAPTKVASIPIEIAGENYVLMKASVNGVGPLTFELDSGGGSGLVLYFKAAQDLGLKLRGKGKGGGAGESTFETSSIKGATLSFPGLEISNETFVVFPKERSETSFDRVVDGVIGFTLFSRYVVEVDYQSRVVNLYEPKTYQYSGSGESIPIKIMSKVPFARAKISIDGRKPLEGDFLVDMGAGRFTTILNTPLVESNNLLAAPRRTMKEPGAQGVGGEVKLMVGRLPDIQLGSFTFTNPVVHFSQDRKGALASSDFSGIIGGELLRRFKVIFDYSRKQMILEPNSDFAAPFEYDMSGIRLRAEGTDFKTLRVRRVVENSPASEIGVLEGDVISTVDGKPAAELSLSQLSLMFKQEGKEYLLEIIRADEKKQFRLKLRRLI